MKKFIIVIALLFIAISSCEKDDICLEDTTPSLIIRFYDIDNPSETKEIESLTVWSPGFDSIYTDKKLDSIVIPLNASEDTTIYKFRSGTTVDDFKLTYNRNDVFVSRSCGYRTVFENIEVKSTKNWIKDYTITNTTIEDETAAHITIFH